MSYTWPCITHPLFTSQTVFSLTASLKADMFRQSCHRQGRGAYQLPTCQGTYILDANSPKIYTNV